MHRFKIALTTGLLHVANCVAALRALLQCSLPAIALAIATFDAMCAQDTRAFAELAFEIVTAIVETRASLLDRPSRSGQVVEAARVALDLADFIDALSALMRGL